MTESHIQHTLTLPPSVDADTFEAFMRERYFPAVHRGPTRVGQITGLTLQRRTDFATGEGSYLLDTAFSGGAGDRLPSLDDAEVRTAFEAFAVEVVFVGTWSRIASLDAAMA